MKIAEEEEEMEDGEEWKDVRVEEEDEAEAAGGG